MRRLRQDFACQVPHNVGINFGSPYAKDLVGAYFMREGKGKLVNLVSGTREGSVSPTYGVTSRFGINNAKGAGTVAQDQAMNWSKGPWSVLAFFDLEGNLALSGNDALIVDTTDGTNGWKIAWSNNVQSFYFQTNGSFLNGNVLQAFAGHYWVGATSDTTTKTLYYQPSPLTRLFVTTTSTTTPIPTASTVGTTLGSDNGVNSAYVYWALVWKRLVTVREFATLQVTPTLVLRYPRHRLFVVPAASVVTVARPDQSFTFSMS